MLIRFNYLKLHGERKFGSLLHSLKTSFCTPLVVFEEMNANSFVLDHRKMTLNSTIFLPMWLREIANKVPVKYVGFPLNKVGRTFDANFSIFK